MKKIHEAADLPEAHLLVHELQLQGIPARILNANAQGGLGEIPFVNAWPQIWIEDERDQARAEAVIRAFEARPVVIGQVHCGRCGEENPASFETCWACGHPLERRD